MLISFDDARSRLLNDAQKINDVIDLPLANCLGRVLAKDIESPHDIPEFDNSSVDGYAIAMADINSSKNNRLPIAQRIIAGVPPGVMNPGTAARIFTGAPIPKGADAVIMQEHCDVEDGHIAFDTHPTSGQGIRRKGHDLRQGNIALTAGSRLGAAHMGVAASLGQTTLPVIRPLRVSIFFSGNELAAPGTPLKPGQIYNSNQFVMLGMLKGLNTEIINLGIIKDDLTATRAALRQAANGSDLIITSGGMSVGEEDHVKAAIEAEGELNLWKIAAKPGKPLAFGKVGRTPFIGLPGNPVAVWVTFITLVLPYLKTRQGMTEIEPARQRRTINFSWQTGDRREFVRVRQNAHGQLNLHPNQDSGALSSAAWADGLADIPAHSQLTTGDSVDYWPAPGFSV